MPSVRTHEQRAVGDSFSQASRMANSKSARRVVGSSHGTSGEEVPSTPLTEPPGLSEGGPPPPGLPGGSV